MGGGSGGGGGAVALPAGSLTFRRAADLRRWEAATTASDPMGRPPPLLLLDTSELGM